MYNRFLVLVAAVAVAMLAPGRAQAHDLHAKVKLLPDAVVVEAWFVWPDEDEPAKGVTVEILDGTGAKVAEGKTDEKGVCRLAKLGPGKYKAKVLESRGHADEVEFHIEAAATPLDAPIEYARERPNQAIGLAVGVGGLLAASVAYWLLRRRK
jgi:hypothetical protein